jgi:hypothetical protein
MDPRNVASSPEPVSTPADQQDPNHPHYCGGLEYQSGSRRSVITTKRVTIAAGVVTTSLFIIAAAIWSVALTRNHDEKAVAATAASMTPDTIISAPLETHTVSVIATMTVYSTMRVSFLVARLWLHPPSFSQHLVHQMRHFA